MLWLSGFDLGTPTVRAAVLLALESRTVTIGETALIGVFAVSDAGDVLSGFNLPLDIGNDGDGLPTGLALHDEPIQGTLYPFTDLSVALNSLISVDGVVNGSGANLVLTPTPTKLFDLAINTTSANAGLTTIPIHIVNPTSPFNQFALAGPSEIFVTDIFPGSLTVLPPPLPGDFDSDGEVDNDDLMAWRIGFGIAIGADLLDGDGDSDRNVDGNDFYVWQRSFGNTSSDSAVGFATPEPSSLALMLGTVAVGWSVSSRQAWSRSSR